MQWLIEFYAVLQGLKPVLEACTDGELVLRAQTLDYGLRCKLAAVVVNHLIQNKQPKGFVLD